MNVKINDLPEIEGINWDKAQKNIPTMDMLGSIITEFCTKASREMDSVRSLYAVYFKKYDLESIKNYRIKAHSLKHTAALIGAEELSDEAKSLEFIARDIEAKLGSSNRDKNLSIIININKKLEKGTEPFCRHYTELAAKVAEAFEINISEELPRMEKDRLLEDIRGLKTAMEDFDIEALNSIMDGFEEFSFEPEIAGQIDRLGEAVLSLDSNTLNEAAARIESIIGQDS